MPCTRLMTTLSPLMHPSSALSILRPWLPPLLPTALIMSAHLPLALPPAELPRVRPRLPSHGCPSPQNPTITSVLGRHIVVSDAAAATESSG